MTEYYQLEAKHPDWLVILGRMLGSVPHRAEDVSITTAGDTATYLINREVVTADLLAKTLNSTPEVVTKAKRLILHPIKGQENWQRPTVNYVGLA